MPRAVHLPLVLAALVVAGALNLLLYADLLRHGLPDRAPAMPFVRLKRWARM